MLRQLRMLEFLDVFFQPKQSLTRGGEEEEEEEEEEGEGSDQEEEERDSEEATGGNEGRGHPWETRYQWPHSPSAAVTSCPVATLYASVYQLFGSN